MIKIFNATETDFSSNGDAFIKPLKCKEYKKKSLNGWYIEVEIPIQYMKYIEKDKLCVIQTRSKKNPQAFRIGADTIKKTGKKISFIANHVMFDAKNYFLLDVRPTNLNAAGTLEYINSRTDIKSPFKVFSNVENINTEYFIRKNLLEAWTLIEERWQGIFDADNFDIYFMNHIGNDNGETIVYGKNMEEMIIFEDWSNVCTKIYAVGYDDLMLPEKCIESEVKYEQPYTKTINFGSELDISTRTNEQMITELRENAVNYLNKNKYPRVSYEVSSNINQSMEIGDTIWVKHPLIDIETEVLEYVNDNMLDRIVSITFGNYSRSVKSKFDSIKSSITNVQNLVSKQEITIQEQQTLINTLNKTGYIYIDENEILILDKFPKKDAKNIWRFGMGGIGFSSNGYEGPFKVAITMDGQINADFITTGKLSVNVIEGLAETLDKWSKIMLDMESIKLIVQNTVDITKEKETNNSNIILEDCMKGNLVEFRIKGNNNVFSNNNSILRVNSENLKNEIPYVTANLDKTDWHYNTGLQNCRSLVLPIFGNRKYTVNKLAGERFALGTFSEEPVAGTIANNYASDENEGKDLSQLEITSKEDDKYLVIFFYDGSLEENLDELYNSLEIYSGLQEIDLGITDTLRIVEQSDEKGNVTEIFDEVNLKSSILTLIRRIGIDSDGNLYVLDEEQVFNLKTLYINLENGTNTIQISDYEDVYLYCKYVITNQYTKLFSTRVETNVMIELLKNQINLAVTQSNVIAAIQLAIDNGKGSIDMKADQFSVQSQYFTLTKEGHITATSGTIAGFEMWTDVASGETRSWLTKNFSDSGNTYRSGLLVRNSYNTDFLFCGMPIASDGSWNTANAATRILNNGKIITKNLQMNCESGSVKYVYDNGYTAKSISGLATYEYLSNGNYWAYEGVGYTNGTPSCILKGMNDALFYEIQDLLHSQSLIRFYRIDNSGNAAHIDSYCKMNIYSDLYCSGNINVGGYPIPHSVYTDAQRITQIRHNVSYMEYSVENYGTFGVNCFSSDEKLKKDIKLLKNINATSLINKIKHYSFKWNESNEDVEIGYLTQQLEKINPNLILKIKQPKGSRYKELQQVNDTILIPYLTMAFQEFFKRYIKLEKKVNNLEMEKRQWMKK